MGHRTRSIRVDELLAEWDKFDTKDPVGEGWVKVNNLARHWNMSHTAARHKIEKLKASGMVETTVGRQNHTWVRIK